MSEEKRLTQIVIGTMFALFLLVTMLINIVRNLSDGFVDVSISAIVYYASMGMFFITSLLTLPDYDWARGLQSICMLVMSYTCFLFNGSDDFFSWGFLLLFILLAWYYDQFLKYLGIKMGLFVGGFIVVTFISSVLHKEPSIIWGNLIYFSCVFFFLAFIFRNLLSRMFRNEQRIVSLEETLAIKDEELRLIQEKASVDEGLYDGAGSMIELQQKVSELEEENSKLKEEIKNNITTYSNRSNLIRLTKESVDGQLRKCSGLEGLKDIDYKILASFFLSKGGKTNREIAYELDTSETAIKNRLHVIMKQLGVPSRTNLLVKIFECIEKTSEKTSG